MTEKQLKDVYKYNRIREILKKKICIVDKATDNMELFHAFIWRKLKAREHTRSMGMVNKRSI